MVPEMPHQNELAGARFALALVLQIGGAHCYRRRMTASFILEDILQVGHFTLWS
jgi:hypothetical protein